MNRRPLGAADDYLRARFVNESLRRIHASRLFQVALVLRLTIVWLMNSGISDVGEFSRDSAKFHIEALSFVSDFVGGEFHWNLWVDHGWVQFVSWIYYFGFPYLAVIQAINCVIGSYAVVGTYYFAHVMTDDEPSARAAAWLYALFPSVLWYTCLPLKEAAAGFALVGVVNGIYMIQSQQRGRGALWVMFGLLILAALRVYLTFVMGAIVLASIMVSQSGRSLVAMIKSLAGIALVAILGVIAINTSDIDLEQHELLKYFDFDYINRMRTEMSAGRTKMYTDKSEAQFGDDAVQNATNAARGLFYFFASIDVTNINRSRQLAAVPEMLLLLWSLPCMIFGTIAAWRRDPQRALPVILTAIALIVVYGGATTNMGAMYRWRMQALPFLFALMTWGATVRGKGLFGFVEQFRPKYPVTYPPRTMS